MRIAATAFCFLLALSAISPAKEGARSLLENGSFERVVRAGEQGDSGHGAWRVGAEGMIPSGWTLNTVYPGTIAVVSEGAADGEHCIRVTGGPKRDGQFYRPVTSIRPNTWYRLSALVKGGAASILVYEYRTGGEVKPHTVVSEPVPPNLSAAPREMGCVGDSSSPPA